MDGKQPSCVCRFFLATTEFEREVSMYRTAALRDALPPLLYATENTDAAESSTSGYVWPPFLVVERGTTLGDWAAEPRAFGAVLNMLHEVASLLQV